MLECNNLTKHYGNRIVLDHISLNMEEGHIYALLGKNGSGKSTFMKAIAGLVKPEDGTITFQGEKIGYKTKEYIAYMPSESFFYDYMTVRNVKNYFKDFYKDFDEVRFIELINKMELSENEKVKSLSSGETAKLMLATTLARKARLYMLDEPFNGIDLIAREVVITTILEAANENTTLIISSHMVEELENLSDRLIFLNKGKIALAGDTEELRETYGKSVTELYKERLA